MQSLFSFTLLCLAFYCVAPLLHSMDKRWSLAPLYAWLAFITTAMVYVTDSQLALELGPFRFLVGSSVFFVSLLITVFIIYTFESIQAVRLAMIIALAISILAPLFHYFIFLMPHISSPELANVPALATFRISFASTFAMTMSFLLMVILWQFFRNKASGLPLPIQVFLTLIVTMVFDSYVFVTGAFLGKSYYASLLGGHLLNRLMLPLLAAPVLAFYLRLRINDRTGFFRERRLFAIFQSSRRAEADLSEARREIRLRRETERALRESEEKFRLISASAHDAIIMMDDTGRVSFWNEAAESIFGYTQSEALGKHLHDLISPPEHVTGFKEGLARFRETGTGNILGRVYETQGMRKDGSRLPVELSVSPFQLRNSWHAVGIVRDISWRKKADAALAEARHKEQETESRIEELLLRGQAPEKIRGAEISALSVPSQHMDGDFFDFFEHAPDCLDILVGDVMGKGIQAALIGAGAKSRFLREIGRAPRHKGEPPAIRDVLDDVYEDVAPQLLRLERFITLVYARVDLKRKRLDFVDCGHMRTIHYRTFDKRCEFLEGENMPMGFVETEELVVASADIKEGDILLFYSDGVTESQNKEGEIFDEKKLADYVCAHRYLSPVSLVHAIRGTVAEFSGSNSFHDDFTCIALRIGDNPGESAEIELDSDLAEMPRMREFLRGVSAKIDSCSWNSDRETLLLISMQEIVVNIIEHGLGMEKGHPVKIQAEWDHEHLALNILHEGLAFNPTQQAGDLMFIRTEDDVEDRGYGLTIIRNSTDSCSSGQIDSKNACTILLWHLHEEE
ncbi:MAG: SpoIIE family protein phosphatase [Candidatus Sumerlaeota bacterium]